MVPPRSRHWYRFFVIGAGLTVAAMASLGGCAGQGGTTADVPVRLAIDNRGSEPLRCTILFGHWVEQGVGTIAPGEIAEVAMWRQHGDGALYVPRTDGRKMMMENLVCGPSTGWWERRADIPLLGLRAGTSLRFTATCRVEARALCSEPAAQ